MRTRELKIQKDNRKAIEDKTGLEFEQFLGCAGQQNYSRVTIFNGFVFTSPDKVDLKVWKRDKDHKNVFVPNRKTKVGREMAKFLENGLKKGNFMDPFDILKLEHPRKFTFPFVEITDNEIIVLFLDEKMEPTDKNVIEITKREFDELLKK
ncbi:MAG: hypothetical protein PHT69_02675 [Bacteroidales bacterium]|nr:hypothetical protein [Bacteroidales bacterium]